jgi:hypothetical protein
MTNVGKEVRERVTKARRPNDLAKVEEELCDHP